MQNKIKQKFTSSLRKIQSFLSSQNYRLIRSPQQSHCISSLTLQSHFVSHNYLIILSQLISMNHHRTQPSTPPYLKYSLISFKQYCNRDFFSQHALLLSQQQKLYSNARNRRKVTFNTQNPSFSKKQIVNQPERKGNSVVFKNDKLKQQLVKDKRAQILNVTPAVIHSTASSRVSSILSQRVRHEQRQNKNNKVFRCKTVSFECNSQESSFSFKETDYSQNLKNISSRPRTASQNLSGLNKIRVYLPSHFQNNNKIKDQQINPWDIYEDQGL